LREFLVILVEVLFASVGYSFVEFEKIKVTTSAMSVGLCKRKRFRVLVGITVLSIESMMLLVLASICFPSKVSFVDSRNKNIHFVTWLVLQVGVLSCLFGWLSNLCLGGLGSLLNGFSSKRVALDVFVLDNLVVLHFACVESLGLLDIVVFFLNSVEALNGMLGHCARAAAG